ncbi:MAG: chorismate mutase [Geitlerinemataceae cyanobacterium]
MAWKLKAIRGATTVPENSAAAMREAVTELLDALEANNAIDFDEVVSVTFSVTRDLTAIFPAAIARRRAGWDGVPLLDVQHMHVDGDLPRCIRFLIHAYLPADRSASHIYLRHARDLRPDLADLPALAHHST